jgi:polar amino acid transport system substrate-binding protein
LFANQIDDLKKVTLQLEWKHQFEFAGFYAAIEKGYYKDVGLELEIREFQEGINITQEVLSGNATFGISSSALILEKLNKKPVVLIASYFKQNALAVKRSEKIGS